MNLEGDLQTSSLQEILKRVSGQSSTGILTIQGEQDIIAVSFLDGNIVAADALSDTLEEGLGEVLASEGLVSAEEFSRIVTEQQTLGGHLPELLVKRQIISREQLLDALRLKIYRMLLGLLTWKEGDFKLFVGNEVSFEDGIQPLSVEEVLVRAMTDISSEGMSGSLPDLDTIYEPRSDPRTIKILGQDGDRAIRDAGTVWLTSPEKMLLDRLDGRLSASMIVQEMGLDRYKALYGLHRLLEAQLVRRRRKASDPVLQSNEPVPAPKLPPPLYHPEIEEPSYPSIPEEVPVYRPQPPPPGFPPPKGSDKKKTSDISISSLPVFFLTMALAILLSALAGSRSSNGWLQLPFTWQQEQRSKFQEAQLRSLYLKIDRAAKTYYLLNGHPPETLGDLVDMRLLAPQDLEDAQGRWISYARDEDSYTLRPIERGEPVAGAEKTTNLKDNLLLNPSFAKKAQRPRKPLILLE